MSVNIVADVINDFLRCPYYAFNHVAREVYEKNTYIENMLFIYTKFATKYNYTKAIRSKIRKHYEGVTYKHLMNISRFFSSNQPKFNDKSIQELHKKGGRYVTDINKPIICDIGNRIKIHTNITFAEKKYKSNYNGTMLTLFVFSDITNRKEDILNDWKIITLIYDAYARNYHHNLKLVIYNYDNPYKMTVKFSEQLKEYVYSKVFKLKQYIDYWYKLNDDKSKLINYKTYNGCANCCLFYKCCGNLKL